jgi:hypothetical protein
VVFPFSKNCCAIGRKKRRMHLLEREHVICLCRVIKIEALDLTSPSTLRLCLPSRFYQPTYLISIHAQTHQSSYSQENNIISKSLLSPAPVSCHNWTLKLQLLSIHPNAWPCPRCRSPPCLRARLSGRRQGSPSRSLSYDEVQAQTRQS